MTPEKVLIACKPACGHVEVVGGLDTATPSDLREWLERGLVLRMIPLEEFRSKYRPTMLCKCPESA